jgi:hypothetical protein
VRIIGLAMLLMTAGVTPQDRAFVDQAKRCGVKSNQIVWKVDAEGQRHPSITPNGDFRFQSLRCMLEWAQRSRVRIGFISEPPPAK